MKKILILGASRYYIDIIKEIKKLGYLVYVIDKDMNAPGFKYADKCEVIDIINIEEVLGFCKKFKVDGVMPINDFGTRAAYYAIQKLNLIGPNYLSGICGNDKGLMRDIWRKVKIAQPDYFIFTGFTNKQEIVDRIGFPMIVKPTDAGGGGRGVSLIKCEEEMAEAIECAKKYNNGERLIAEEFIEGREFIIDGIIYKSKLSVILIGEQFKAEGKHRVNKRISYPAVIGDLQVSTIKDLCRKATDSLGLTNCAVHLEIIECQKERNLYLIEMGIRGGGGHIFSRIMKEVTGINGPQELAKIFCDDVPNLTIKSNNCCEYRFLIPPKVGLIQNIHIDEKLPINKKVIDYGLTIQSNTYYRGLENGTRRCGFILVSGKTVDECYREANLLESQIQFVY